MALYTHGARTAVTASGNATWELRTASTDRAHVLEIGVFLSAATASTFGLGRPAAIGVTPTTPVTLQAMDPGEGAGTTTTAVGWATAPTTPTSSIYLRRIGLPATVGAGVIWTFPYPGIVISVSSSLVLYTLSLTAAADVYVTVDE
jgi:hypothetical protein